MSRDYTAFTIVSPDKRRLREIKIPMVIMTSDTESVTYQQKRLALSVIALWDTGATCSGITERAAKALQLTSYGMTEVSTAAGVAQDIPMYHIDFELTDNADLEADDKVHFYDIPVIELPNSSSFDFLVGMDIITHGDFSITNANGCTVVSYRLPPDAFHIDYMKMKQSNKSGKRHRQNLKRYQTR